jgi:hypothetical protein
MPAIAFVDNVDNDRRPDHFVLIIGKDEHGNYFINDPWEGETYYFHAKYANPAEGIYGLRLYTGTPQVIETPQDALNDLTDKLKQTNEMLAEKSLEVNALRDALQEQEADNKDLASQLLTARGKCDSAILEKQRLEIENKKLTEENTKLKSDKELLETRIRILTDSKVVDWPWLRLFYAGFRKMLRG